MAAAPLRPIRRKAEGLQLGTRIHVARTSASGGSLPSCNCLIHSPRTTDQEPFSVNESIGLARDCVSEINPGPRFTRRIILRGNASECHFLVQVKVT